MFNFGFKIRNKSLPRANLVVKIPNRYPFIDRIGKHDGPPQLLQYIQGPVDLLSASIVGTESITNKQGTASVTVSAGKLSVGAGTLWSFVLSNGSKYEFGSGGWVWDVSANDRPLSVPVDACKEGREFGSDWLNKEGWSKRQNLFKNSDNIGLPPWTGTSAIITAPDTIAFNAVSNAKLTVFSSSRVYLKAGNVLRFSANISESTLPSGRISIGIVEGTAPYANTYRALYLKEDGLIEVRHAVTVDGLVSIYIGTTSAEAGSCKIKNITTYLWDDDDKDLVSFGDSICWTSVESGGAYDESASYTERYALAENIPFRKYGVSGETLSQIATRFESQVGKPGTIFIEGGVNTITHAVENPISSMQIDMAAMVSVAKGKTRNIIIFDCPIFGLSAEDPREDWRVEWNAWLASYCVAEKLTLVPMSQILDNPLYYSVTDNWHPNRAGHAAIATWLVENISYTGNRISRAVTTNTIVSGLQPASLNNLDTLNNPLQYPGQVKLNIIPVSNTDDTTINPTDTYRFTDTNAWRVVTGWTAGTANFGFDANGVPISFTGQQLIDAGIGPRLYCGLKGVGGYTVDQDAPTNAKIIKILKVSTYIDTLYWADSAEMDWSASNE